MVATPYEENDFSLYTTIGREKTDVVKRPDESVYTTVTDPQNQAITSKAQRRGRTKIRPDGQIDD